MHLHGSKYRMKNLPFILLCTHLVSLCRGKCCFWVSLQSHFICISLYTCIPPPTSHYFLHMLQNTLHGTALCFFHLLYLGDCFKSGQWAFLPFLRLYGIPLYGHTRVYLTSPYMISVVSKNWLLQ